ncbi:MAG: CpaF family protein [Bacillota bacterium]|nr:CpaF family protein [Bacillota bacterium]
MGLMERMNKQNPVVDKAAAHTPAGDEHAALRQQVHHEVVDLLNKQRGDAEVDIREMIDGLLELYGSDTARPERNRVAREIYNEVKGLGPLEQLLADESISEIMINGPKKVYIERKGRLERSEVAFHDDQHVMSIIDRIVSPLGRHIDEANPMVDARLPDGSRVNAIIPPLALNGPTVTIRKFASTPLTVADLISFGSLNTKMSQFLEACVKGKMNIIVSGGTGSGKTTLLNVLSAYIPSDERIITIEDAAELQLRQEHVLTLESRAANLEGQGAVTIRDLVRNALRMRPDRIVVGEVRGGETLDMLQAMNTGHDGSLTTAHANSPRDALSRLETMALMAGMQLPLPAIRQQISSAIDIVVQQSRMRDGSRKVSSVTEVLGMEGDIIVMQEIFKYEGQQKDIDGSKSGRFVATGIKPYCCDKMSMNGVSVNETWFSNAPERW